MKSAAPTIARRTFLERLGLGASAVLLGPVASAIVNEARGAVSPRRLFGVYLTGNGLSPGANFTPTEFQFGGDKAGLERPVMDGPRPYSWPAIFKPLEPYRGRTLLLDGFANVPKVAAHGHSAGYSALSCFPAANSTPVDGGAPPGGVTFDQHMANTIGATTWQRSVLFGVSRKTTATLATTFATGAWRPEPHVQSAAMLFGNLFGQVAGGGDKGRYRQQTLLDSMRGDIKRLEAALAGPDRRKLEQYLGAVQEFDKRQGALGVLTCAAPTAPPSFTDKTHPEDVIESMNEMAILAMICGMTNVIGMAIGCGMSHDYMPRFSRLAIGTPYEKAGHVDYYGHEPPSVQGPAMELIHRFGVSLLARTAAALSAVKDGDGTLFDRAVFMYTSDNAEGHHSEKERWPLALVGSAGGKLKADGRFLRYPIRRRPGNRSMADLFCTLSTALGVPSDDFGKGGNEPVQGPIAELLT